MIKISRKIFFLRLEQIWFQNNISSTHDVIRYMRVPNKIENDSRYIANNASYTVITQLNKSEEELLKDMKKNVRYEIKKCINEDVSISFYNSEDISENPSILKEFENAYMTFASGNKKLTKAFSKRKIDSYCDNNCITLSSATFPGGKVFHVYVNDENNTVLIYSASNFREENVDRNLAGRVNKLLHYKDMIYFKGLGLTTYDWGNISSPYEPNGIDVFKMSFGGEVCKVYNIYLGNSLIGNATILLLKKYLR
ncbi:hypothetical protein E9840_08585 [Tissierella creatinini]|nr:hypothetical protein E9840_08585 [Tissierella creatinini]TJX61063.1 hypothetical protein E8P77_18925 [Soehngenia saccharolytica]